MLAIEGFSWGDGLSDAWSRFATFAPKVVAFLVVLVIGRIVVGFLRRALVKALTRFGFDRAVDRAGLHRALSGQNSTPSRTVGKLAHYALMLFLLTLAFSVFGPTNPVSVLLNRLVAYLPKVFVAIAIVVVAGLVARAVRELVHSLLVGKVPNAQLLAKAAGIAVTVIGAFAAIDQLDIASSVVNGLFYAMLAIIVGSSVIAIGGGGIVPMRRQWDRAIDRFERSVDSIDVREPSGYVTSSPAGDRFAAQAPATGHQPPAGGQLPR